MINNVLFTGAEIRTVIERSSLPIEVRCQIWASFVDYAIVDKRLSIEVTSKDSIESRDDDDEPHLFV